MSYGSRMGWRLAILLALTTSVRAEDWKALLADADPAERVRAAEALATSGAAEAVPDLAECLFDRSVRLRAAAAHALGRAGAAANPALPELKRLFGDTQREVRVQAYAAVARIGDVGAIAEAVRRDRGVLGLFGEEHEDVLRALLKSESWHVRLWVLQHKPIRFSAPVAWIEPLAELAANDPAQVVRLYAVGALAHMRKPEALPALLLMIDNRDARIRAAALMGIAWQLPKDGKAVRAVEARLGDEVPQIRAHACYALRDRKAAAALIELLLDAPEPELRLVAGAVLGEMGLWPHKAGDLLVKAAIGVYGFKAPYPVVFENERNLRAGGGSGWRDASKYYPSVNRMARDAVLASGGKAVPALERAYKTEADANQREHLVFALGHLRAAPSLVPALSDAALEVRRVAAACRAWLGEKDAVTATVLVGSLAGARGGERYTAVDWSATASPLVVKMGAAALPALESRLAIVSKKVWREDLGGGAGYEMRNEADVIEEKRIRELIARIRAQ